MPARATPLGVFGLVWGVGGVVWLLSSAVYRLTPRALEPIETGMEAWGWALYVVSIAFMAYTEGYKGFQKNFSPRVVVRAFHLLHHPRPLHVLLAPLFCMALFHATKKRLIVAWTILVGVVALVLMVRQLDQPWRGMVDAGVVIGLSWGLIALVVFFARAISDKPPDVDAGLPERDG